MKIEQRGKKKFGSWLSLLPFRKKQKPLDWSDRSSIPKTLVASLDTVPVISLCPPVGWKPSICHVIPPPTPTATATTVGDTIDGLQGEGCSLVPWLGEKVWNNSSPIMLTMVSLNVWTISPTFFQVTHGHSKVATILMQQVLGMGNFVQKLKIERLRKTTSLRTNV